MILYDPIFGISFTSLIPTVFGVVVVHLRALIVMVREMPYEYKLSRHTVRIKPARMKNANIMIK